MNAKEVVKLFRAGYPLLWVRTSEPIRAKEEIARAFSEELQQVRVKAFSLTSGASTFTGEWSPEGGRGNLYYPFQETGVGEVCLVLGYDELLKKPDVASSVLDFISKGVPHASVIFLSPALYIPPSLERYITLVDFDLPGKKELRRELRAFAQANEVDVENPDACVNAGRGLTLFEFVNAMAYSVVKTREERGIGVIKPQIILRMKEQMVEKSSALQVFHPEDLDEVKGLEIARSFIRRAIATKMGKGVLLVGVPGTGKSLLAKTVGREMGLPTVILEFGAVFGSLVGESEQRLRDALKVVEAMSPCILMVDEIEKGLAGTQSSKSDGGTGARLLGMFLKWLNDRKEGEVFVIATANDIEALPPEFVRAERWDTMFFVDVPAADELRELFDYYCEKYGVEKPERLELYEGYTGAEVKQLCKIAKMFDKTVDEVKDFVKPVVETQKEKIEKLREWAKSRCVPASLSRIKGDSKVRRVL